MPSLSGSDNSGGQAGFTTQRDTATSRRYAQIAQVSPPGSIFSGCSGGGSSRTDPRALAGNKSVTVAATSSLVPTYILTVTKQGPGTVSSSQGQISYGSTCSARYARGTVAPLTGVPAKREASFVGWNGRGGCSTDICNMALNAATSVAASFSKGTKK